MIYNLDNYKQLQLEWNEKYHHVQKLVHNGYFPKREEITVCVADSWLADWSLAFNHGIFRFKLVDTFVKLMQSNPQQIKDFIQIVTDWEKSNKQKVNDYEMAHVLELKLLVDYVIKHRYPEVDREIRRRTLGGEDRRQTYF
jgi:hypothetical protein